MQVVSNAHHPRKTCGSVEGRKTGIYTAGGFTFKVAQTKLPNLHELIPSKKRTHNDKF